MSLISPESPRSRAWSYACGGVGVVAACVTPVVATGAWLLLTNGEIAADVASSGDLMPLALAIAETLGQALRDLLAFL